MHKPFDKILASTALSLFAALTLTVPTFAHDFPHERPATPCDPPPVSLTQPAPAPPAPPLYGPWDGARYDGGGGDNGSDGGDDGSSGGEGGSGEGAEE